MMNHEMSNDHPVVYLQQPQEVQEPVDEKDVEERTSKAVEATNQHFEKFYGHLPGEICYLKAECTLENCGKRHPYWLKKEPDLCWHHLQNKKQCVFGAACEKTHLGTTPNKAWEALCGKYILDEDWRDYKTPVRDATDW